MQILIHAEWTHQGRVVPERYYRFRDDIEAAGFREALGACSCIANCEDLENGFRWVYFIFKTTALILVYEDFPV